MKIVVIVGIIATIVLWWIIWGIVVCDADWEDLEDTNNDDSRRS